MDRFFEDQVVKITEEQKQGIGTADGYGLFVVPKIAKGIAKRRFIDGSVNVARREVSIVCLVLLLSCVLFHSF